MLKERSSHYDRLLEDLRLQPPQADQDIEEVLQVKQRMLHFSNVLPGKLLGSKLTVQNKTNCDQIIELSLDQSSYMFSRQAIVKNFPEASSISIQKSERIINSEVKHQCWYIENPVNKEFTKQITLKLAAEASQEFIIVLRSPCSKVLTPLLSVINLGLLTCAND